MEKALSGSIQEGRSYSCYRRVELKQGGMETSPSTPLSSCPAHPPTTKSKKKSADRQAWQSVQCRGVSLPGHGRKGQTIDLSRKLAKKNHVQKRYH